MNIFFTLDFCFFMRKIWEDQGLLGNCFLYTHYIPLLYLVILKSTTHLREFGLICVRLCHKCVINKTFVYGL